MVSARKERTFAFKLVQVPEILSNQRCGEMLSGGRGKELMKAL